MNKNPFIYKAEEANGGKTLLSLEYVNLHLLKFRQIEIIFSNLLLEENELKPSIIT